jgi:hypothetical protein
MSPEDTARRCQSRGREGQTSIRSSTPPQLLRKTAPQEDQTTCSPNPLPRTQNSAAKGENDDEASPSPNLWILGFYQGTRKEGKGMYLDVASKEENIVRDVCDVRTPSPARDSPGKSPSPITPRRLHIQRNRYPKGGICAVWSRRLQR